MSFLLDTNIVSAQIKRPGGMAHRFVRYSGRLYISSLALGELYAWAFGKAGSNSRWSAIEVMLRDEVNPLDVDDDCARKSGQLRVELLRQGIGASPVDLLITSVALLYDLTLVTNNTADFQHIPGLRLDDWLTPWTQQAVLVDTENVHVLKNLSNGLIKLSRLAEAEQALRQATTIFPRDVTAAFGLTEALECKDSIQSRDRFQLLLRSNSGNLRRPTAIGTSLAVSK